MWWVMGFAEMQMVCVEHTEVLAQFPAPPYT